MRNPFLTPTDSSSLWRKAVGLFATAALIALALMFSALLLAFLLAAGALAWGYLWWKTRAFRKEMRSARETPEPTIKGEIIEGEAIHVVDSATLSARK